MTINEKKNIPRSVQTLTITEAAEALRINSKTMYDHFNRGELPYVVVGKRRRIRVTDLEAYLEKSAR